jgi:hypothetical protein
MRQESCQVADWLEVNHPDSAKNPGGMETQALGRHESPASVSQHSALSPQSCTPKPRSEAPEFPVSSICPTLKPSIPNLESWSQPSTFSPGFTWRTRGTTFRPRREFTRATMPCPRETPQRSGTLRRLIHPSDHAMLQQ